MRLNLSLVYSVIITAVIVLSLFFATGFMSVGEGERLEVIMQVLVNALIIVYIFFLAILAAVALGFASLFFKLDELEGGMLKGLLLVEDQFKRQGR